MAQGAMAHLGPNFVFLPLRGLRRFLNPVLQYQASSRGLNRLGNFKNRSIDCAVNSSRLPFTSPRIVRADTHGHDHGTVRSRLAPFSATPEGARTLIKSHPFDFQALGLQLDLDLIVRFMLRSCTASAREPSLSTLSHVSESRGSVVLAPLPDPESPHLCFCWSCQLS